MSWWRLLTRQGGLLPEESLEIRRDEREKQGSKGEYVFSGITSSQEDRGDTLNARNAGKLGVRVWPFCFVLAMERHFIGGRLIF